MGAIRRHATLLGLLMFSGPGSGFASGLTEPNRQQNPTLSFLVMASLSLMGTYQLLMYRRRRSEVARRALGLFCLFLLFYWTLVDGHWDAALTVLLQPISFAFAVPLLMIYVQELFPQKWFQGMIAFTWAYVIPYIVIILVYPIEQILPIVPAMQNFSGLSLLATLTSAMQARHHKLPHATLLTFSLLILFASAWIAGLAAYGLLLFLVCQALLLFRRAGNAGLPRP